MIHAAIQQKLTQHCKTNILQLKKKIIYLKDPIEGTIPLLKKKKKKKKKKERTVSYVCNYKMPC